MQKGKVSSINGVGEKVDSHCEKKKKKKVDTSFLSYIQKSTQNG
jgi:hypothetical protein